ncbi:alpha/beta hydrolase [Jiangella ureilytica]|nr:alpha/beta hydrolase [Jiangella ureilytica]
MGPTVSRDESGVPRHRRHSGRISRWSVAIVTVAMVATAMPASADARSPSAVDTSGHRQVGWTACGPRLECASVPVPLDWDRPSGATISLSVIRHLASDPEERIGSLFFNPGGPGGSGVGAVAERGDSLDALTQGRFDIVGWDIRGSGGSAPVSCFDDAAARAGFWEGLPVPTTGAEERRYFAKTVALAHRCGELNGDLLAHISTVDTARDLDHLRRLVGDQRLSYLGESYGTHIGQTYANLFPNRVRAMALDGLVDSAAAAAGLGPVLASSLRGTDQVFRRFLELCETAGPDRCALAGHGPVAARVELLLDRLRHAPIPAPDADPPGVLTYGETLTALKFVGLPNPALWPQVAALLEAAFQGDGSAIANIAAGATSDEARLTLQEQGVALVCADTPARRHPAAWPSAVGRLEMVSRVAGPVVGWINAPCASWPAASPDRHTGPWNATTPNPILLIGTRFDPNTPLASARLADRRLGNAVLLIHDGYGHLSRRDPSTCVIEATGRYLVGLVTPPSGTVCPSDRIPFDPEFGQPAD